VLADVELPRTSAFFVTLPPGVVKDGERIDLDVLPPR
jgi:hypothetical protein